MDKILDLKINNFSKSQYDRVIDTSFNQLVNVEISQSSSQISVQEFFENYKSLFFIIPKFGDINSHEYLVKTSEEYIDFEKQNEDFQIFIDEITQLREENLSLQQQLFDLKK